jgi:alpha-glucosidase
MDDRDGARTPMPWGDLEWRDPWLPLSGNTRSVAEQREDPGSVLSFTRRLIALRRSREELAHGSYEQLEGPAGVWAWTRGDRTVVAVNLSGREVQLPLDGRVLLSTGESADPTALAPWSGVVLDV